MVHRIARIAVLGAGIVAWAPNASAQTDAPPPAPWIVPAPCTPGERAPCACENGAPGSRTCLLTGAGMGGCICDAPPRGEPAETWYGWQNILIDAASLAVMLSALSGESALLWTGIGTQAIGGPIVHWTHGQVGRGFASLGLRVGLPGLTLLAAWSSNDVVTLLVGGPIVMLTAWVIDDALLARAPAPTATAGSGGVRLTGLGVVPMADRLGFGVGLLF